MLNRFGRFRLAAVISIVSLTLGLLAPQGASAAPAAGTLDVSPDVYVGGQLITLHGNIGKDGVRRVKLQGSMGRKGDEWVRIAVRKTDAEGNFSFSMPAPSMFGVQRRVVSRRLSTNVLELEARSQDLVLREVGQPREGEPFDIEVDTVPDDNSPVCPLRNRPDLPPPAFPARLLALQQRVGSAWVDVSRPDGTPRTTRTDPQGQALFEDVIAADAGQVVYRVRQENYFVGGNEIGWFPSFPTFVQVVDASTPGGVVEGEPSCPPRTRSGGTTSSKAASEGTGATTASQAFGWAPALWDFGWEHGESLTSPPQRGTDLRGWWQDFSNGGGRASRHNGGFMLDSKRDNANGTGDFGDTWVTLRGNPAKYGRWETRIRLRSHENDARDYRTRIELVPNRGRHYGCGGRNIMIADLAAHSRKMKFGVKSVKAKRKWARTKRVGGIENVAIAVAVEVSKKHISWFVNGKVVGTVKGKAGRRAVSDVPLTMRLTLAGKGDQEMNRTKAIYDWQRGFSLKRGTKVKSGKGLRSRRYGRGC